MGDPNLCLLIKGNKKEMPLTYKAFGHSLEEPSNPSLTHNKVKENKSTSVLTSIVYMGSQNKHKLHFKPHCLWVAGKFPHI